MSPDDPVFPDDVCCACGALLPEDFLPGTPECDTGLCRKCADRVVDCCPTPTPDVHGAWVYCRSCDADHFEVNVIADPEAPAAPLMACELETCPGHVVDDECDVCHVWYGGGACDGCGQHGYHTATCPENDERTEWETAMAHRFTKRKNGERMATVKVKLHIPEALAQFVPGGGRRSHRGEWEWTKIAEIPLVERTAELHSFIDLTDGTRHYMPNPQIMKSSERGENLARNVLYIRAMQQAGWSAYVTGGVEIRIDGRVYVMRCEERK